MTEQRARIVAVGDFTVEQQDLLRQAGGNCSIEFVKDAAGVGDRIESADAIAGHIPPAMLARAKRLRWVHSWAAGPDTQLYREFVEHPVILTCSKGNGAIPLAEHAMMLMLMLNRNALRWLKAQAERRWDPFTHGELNGLTLGIVGTGHSGSDLARKAKAFHMRVLGLRRTSTPADGFDEILPRQSLHPFLAQCDFVVVTAPRTPETEHMFGEAEFRAMKPTAHFICFSRGGIADDAALLKALQENWIAGAGLDAHGIEPLPADSPFWSLSNAITTPHNGATTVATRARGIEIFAENLRRFAAGMPLSNVVDKAAGY